jgi:glucose-1-phosphate adenylyltransferase
MKHESRLMQRVAAVVLAGGEGTRLFPLTAHRCKPAVSFGGKYRLIDIPLSNALNSDIRQIYVISQHFASNLNHYIQDAYRVDQFQSGGIHLLFPEEDPQRLSWFKGTADAVRQNLEEILDSNADYFLILSGDHLYNINFTEMMAFAEQTQADMVVASLPVNRADATRMGLLKINERSEITAFCEKPQDPVILQEYAQGDSYLASMGIYIFKRDVMIALLKEKGNDFGKDLIPLQLQKGGTYCYQYPGYWVDIGTIPAFFEANMALLEQDHCLQTYDETNPIYTRMENIPNPLIKNASIRQSTIGQGAILEGDNTIINSVIGPRIHVKKGTQITNSVLMGHHFQSTSSHRLPLEFSIGENCVIEKAIIDEHANIGKNVTLTNLKGLETYDGDGIYIRGGIIIVSSGSRIPDNFIL